MTNAGTAEGMALVLVLFVGGLLGSFTHCAGMCGPFVVGQAAGTVQRSAGEDASTPHPSAGRLQRLAGRGRLYYHAGRSTTYVALGIVAAYFMDVLFAPKSGHPLPVILLSLAAIIFVWMALPTTLRSVVKLPRGPVANAAGAAIGALSAPFRRQQGGFQQYMMGVLLGFLPCGMLYAALMASASTGNPALAGFAMLAFSVGTMPALVLVAFGHQYVFGRWPSALRLTSRFAMGFNAVILAVMASKLAI